MELKKNIIKQFGKPAGLSGSLVGRLMSIKNKKRSEWTIESLNLKPSDYILEVGYGSGSTFNKAAKLLTTGFISGIDHSEVMYQQAFKKNKNFILNKKARLELGTVWDLNYTENYFDIIYGSNVHFFWKNPGEEFRKLYAFLKPGGRLIMVFQPRWAKNDEDVRNIALDTRLMFKEAGFVNVEINYKTMKPITCISISGLKQ